MHCTSCAEEVAGILRQIPGVEVRSVQVSFVLSRAELAYEPEIVTDVDTAIVAKVLKRFPRLDVVVLINTDVGDEMSGIMRVRISATEGSAQGLMDALVEVPGVMSVTPCTAKEVEVAYDPDRIGIRTILRKLRQPAGFGEVRLDDVPDGGKLAQEAEARHLKRAGIQTVLAAILTIPVLVLAWSGGKLNVAEKTRLAVECSCASMVIIVAYNIYLDALWAAWYGKGFLAKINMDTLVSVATIAAYAFSVGVLAVNLSGKGFGNGEDQEPFFETSTLLTTLILLGRWVTAHVKSRASRKLRSVGDGDLQTTDVRLYDPEQKSEIDLDARELEYGDILVVSQGERVATDGLVIDGSGQLDESHLTGEPKPQHKNEGSFLLAGSTVVSGTIKYRVSKLLQENTISSIKGMVKLASQQKPRKQVLADRVAAVLTPIVFLIACLVFLVWILVEGLVRKAGWGPGAVSAATYAVATLAISCPCALALAVPLVMVVASRVGVERGGFVCKNPAAMEKGPKVRKVVFDKTGTLTTGHLHVDQAQVFKDGKWSSDVPLSVFHVISVLCRTSSHPVARAMFQLASESYLQVRVDNGDPNIEVEDVVSKGIQANINGSVYRGGKLAFTAPDYVDDPIVRKNLQAAQSVFTLSRDHELVAMFSLKDDKIRPEVPAVLKALRDRDIEIYIFSGDRSEAVTPIARELGIPAANVFADCYPEDKRARLEILKKPDQSGAVVFVGDGTNDAIALAAADIGVSLSQATEMASNSADVAIISDSIAGLVGFLALSKRIDTCIKLNFSWAVFWNLFAILGASGAWVSVRIPPEWAGLGELGSVLPVFVISALVGVGFRGFEG
ncbi:heavy metal translocatin [Ascodesmis nigricans]|uniref:Heavy metal translocatin n=1 Tax=Ascodesmis nigricans TaxID=341454 RepID=A0A4S2MW69_9PEZI|nr:heavy metal translocatin [Ascodesmis nigricans]